MSARQAFVPRPPSRLPSSEPHPLPTDARDGDKDMFNGNGKPRSITAFLGQKRGGSNTTFQGAGPTQGAGLGRTNTGMNRRSFEGILRPEMTPISIIPYPPTTQLGAGMKQPGAGQTPRKTVGPGGFEFTRPMTPASVPRGFKKGLVAENRDDEAASNESVHRSDATFMGPEGEADVRIDVGTGTGGYMRMFEGSGGDGHASVLRSSLERDVAAPVPGYALGGLGANPQDEGNEIPGIFARSSRSLGSMTEEDVGLDKNEDSQKSLGGTKRRMRHEDMGENGRFTHEGPQAQRSAKRTKQAQYDPNEYLPISSPHVPPTPGPPTSSVDMPDSSLVVGSLLGNIEAFVSLEQVEADWKRWRECTTDEWLKGADAFAQEYTVILNMVKDHLTEKVMAYARMITSVEEKQTEVKRNIEMIHRKGRIVRENISKLGSKK